MRIVDAVWEKRNLGISTFEITIENEDSFEDVEKAISHLDCDYAVVKLSAQRKEYLAHLQSQGFLFIEDMIHLEHDLSEIPMNPIIKRLYEKTSFRKMNEEDFSQLEEEVLKGMFDTDRISLDKSFDSDASANRYLNWINDLKANDANFYVITYGENSAGFVVLNTKDNITFHSVLGGGYERFRKTGIGIIQKEQEITRKLGGKRVITSVSSNNVGQFRALIMNGYKPYAVDHVLIKHKEVHI